MSRLPDVGRSTPSLLRAYLRVREQHSRYFAGLVPAAGPAKPTPAVWFDSEQPPVDTAVLKYLADIGIPKEHVQRAQWATCRVSSSYAPLVAPALGRNGRVLAVRAINPVRRGHSKYDVPGLAGGEVLRLDSSKRVVELDPEEGLAVEDVPVPLERGVFNAPWVLVSDDPVAALQLRARGLNATSLARPYETLGTMEGLWQLQEMGMLSARQSPRGVLVVLDAKDEPTLGQASLLNGQFSEVLIHRGVDDWPFYFEQFQTGHHGSSLEAFISDLVGNARLTAPPRVLPPRPKGRVWALVRKPLQLVALPDLPEVAGPPATWIIEGFIVDGGLTQALGDPKAGKTTLLLSMLAALTRGDEFLGQSLKATPVVIVSEQSSRTFQSSFLRSLSDGSKLSDYPDLHVLPMEQRIGWGWEEVVEFVESECRRLGARVVVFDTLGQIAGLDGDDENSAGHTRRLYAALRGLVSDGVAVVAVRHTRKTKSSLVNSGLGSAVTAGMADHLFRIQKPDPTSTVRRIDSTGRLSDDNIFRLKLTSSGWIRLPNTSGPEQEEVSQSAAARRAQAEAAVIERVEREGPKGFTGQKILLDALVDEQRQNGLGRKTLASALERVIKTERLIASREGGSGRAFVYSLRSPAPTGHGGEEKKNEDETAAHPE